MEIRTTIGNILHNLKNPPPMYAIFSEYGDVDPCTFTFDEAEALRNYDEQVAEFQKENNTKSDGGMCLGKFRHDLWRKIGAVGNFHKDVEYIAGFRAKKTGGE